MIDRLKKKFKRIIKHQTELPPDPIELGVHPAYVEACQEITPFIKKRKIYKCDGLVNLFGYEYLLMQCERPQRVLIPKMYFKIATDPKITRGTRRSNYEL